jgi:hypothetical protein
MAQTERRTKVFGNPGRRAFGGSTKSKYKKRSAGGGHRTRSNPSILGFTLGNPGRKRSHVATATKKKSKKSKAHHHAGGYKSKYKKNPGGRMHRSRYKRNPGGMSTNVTELVTNAVFVILGALGSKLGAQAVLGTKNTGVMGYAGNAAVGGVLWFITEKLMKNKAASAGIISGTVVQILLRVINDYTPFGSYIANLGMGDYQMQSFVTPQVLVDPYNSAEVAIPRGWGGGQRSLPAGPGGVMPANTPMSASVAAAAAAAPPSGPSGGGMGGLYSTNGWGGLYAA